MHATFSTKISREDTTWKTKTHTHRWTDDLKVDLGKILCEGVGWIEVDQDRSLMVGVCEQGNEYFGPIKWVISWPAVYELFKKDPAPSTRHWNKSQQHLKSHRFCYYSTRFQLDAEIRRNASTIHVMGFIARLQTVDKHHRNATIWSQHHVAS